MAELLRRPNGLPVSGTLCPPSEANVAPCLEAKVAEGPLHMGRHRATNSATLAQAGNQTPVAGPAICRQSWRGRNPREEPDALAGTSGSVRRAPGNRRPYRNGRALPAPSNWAC